LGGHAKQEPEEGAPALGENVTAGQLVQVLDCVSDQEPGKQVWHANRVVAPSIGEAVPAAQLSHTVLAPSA